MEYESDFSSMKKILFFNYLRHGKGTEVSSCKEACG